MTQSSRPRWPAVLAAAVLVTQTALQAPASAAPPIEPADTFTAQENGPAALRSDARRPNSYRVLVFTKTAGVRRPSIQDGVSTIQQLARGNGFTVTVTQDARAFTAANLARYRAVVFLNTTGDVLDGTGRAALRRFVLDGGGWVGVHSAADSEYTSPFHTRLLAGARFLCHPVQQPGVVVREAAAHRSTAHLPERWLVPLE